MKVLFIGSSLSVWIFISAVEQGKYWICIEGVVASWCNPLTLQPEQSGWVGLSPGRAPPLERHDKGLRTRLGLLYFCDPSAWRWKTQLHLHLQGQNSNVSEEWKFTVTLVILGCKLYLIIASSKWSSISLFDTRLDPVSSVPIEPVYLAT